MNPSHHLAIHPPPSENHQLSFSPSTPRASLIRPGRSHSGTSLSSLFHRSIFNAASSSTIYLPIQINILCHASIFPPTFLRSSCLSMRVRRRFISPPTSSTLSQSPRPRLSSVSSAAPSGRRMLIDLKAIIPQKKSQQGFLSHQIGLVL